MAKRRKTRREKDNKKYHLGHVIESEAVRAAHASHSGDDQTRKTRATHDVIAEKSEKYIKEHVERTRVINADIRKSVVFGIVFIILIGGLYAYENSNPIIENISREFLTFLLS